MPNVVDDSVSDEGKRENDHGDDEDQSNQDATVTATIDPNPEQDVDEVNVGEFGDDTADLDDANVTAPIGIAVNVEDQEEEHICLFIESERLPTGADICVLNFGEEGKLKDVGCTRISI